MLPTSHTNSPLPRDLWLKRLTYRSEHRGCKETDLVLGTYCRQQLGTLEESQLALFEAFLEEDDADIWAWLTEKKTCPHAHFEPLLAILREQKLS